MLTTPCHVIGDVHLGVASRDSEMALLALLREKAAGGGSLVVMGDLFDFWFSWQYAMPRVGFRTLAALADLHDAGVPVLWIGGNHDCWGGDALMQETGAHYTLEPWQGAIGPWQAYLAHGDGLREKEDAPYRRLRRVLRHPWSIAAYGLLHPDLATRIAMKSSKTSRKGRARDGGAGLRDVAARQLATAGGPTLVMHGHSHVPTLEALPGGIYANAGAWYLDQQFLRIDADGIARYAWQASGEHMLLNRCDWPIEEGRGHASEVIGRI